MAVQSVHPDLLETTALTVRLDSESGQEVQPFRQTGRMGIFEKPGSHDIDQCRSHPPRCFRAVGRHDHFVDFFGIFFHFEIYGQHPVFFQRDFLVGSQVADSGNFKDEAARRDIF